MAKTNIGQFIREVRQETAKVTWPTRKETMVTTMMVFVMVFLAAIFFWLVDLVHRQRGALRAWPWRLSWPQRWYVIHVYSGFEKKVAESIREQARQQGLDERIEEVLVPTEEVVEMRRGAEGQCRAQVLSGLCAGEAWI